MLDVLIIGCGNIAGGFDGGPRVDMMPLTHAGAFTRHGGFRLAACVDPDTVRREAFRASWGVSTAAPDIASLAASPGRFDLVSLCSPTALHAEHFEQILALRPRMVFCEKPITPTLAESRTLVVSCDAHGIALAVNHTRRWAPDIVTLASELHHGVYGAVRSAAGCYTKGVLNNGAHMIDLLHMLLGPVEVIAAGAGTYDFWPDDPTIPALLRAGDVPVTLAIGDARDYARFELEFTTEAGVIAMEDGGQTWRIRRAGDSTAFRGYRTLGDDQRVTGRYREAMLAAASNIYAALTEGQALASDGASALAAQVICDRLRTLSERRS